MVVLYAYFHLFKVVLPQLHLALEDAVENKCLNIVFLLTEVNILLALMKQE